MIANYTVGNGFSGALKYCAEKEHAQIITSTNIAIDVSKQGLYLNISDASKQMRTQAKERPRVKKPVLHVSFSFDKTEKITDAKQLEAVQSGLKNIGIDLDKHQAVVVKHNDTDYPHYHVVVNRVDLKGDLHNDHRLMDKLQISCDRVEKELNLQKTEGRTVVYDPTNEKGYSYVKREKKVKTISKNPKQASEKKILDTYENAKKTATDIESLKKECLKNGIEIKVSTNKNGIFGVSFQDQQTKKAVKGSKLGIKAKELNQVLEQNKNLDKSRARPEPQTNISNEIGKYKNCESEYFEKRADYNAMVDSKTENLIRGRKDDNSLGNSADLVAIENEYKRINQEHLKNISEKKEKLEELNQVPQKETSFWDSKTKKNEINAFNQELEFKKHSLKEDIENTIHGGKMVSEMKLKVFTSELKKEKETNLRNEMNRNKNAIQEQGQTKGFDIEGEIKKREIIKQREEREQKRERSRSRGGRSM